MNAFGNSHQNARSWHRRLAPLRRNKLVLIGITLVALVMVAALLAPWLAPYDPLAMDVLNSKQPPSRMHWFGTDQFGRDILSRVMYGGRISLLIGLSSTAATIVLGTIIGLTGGYFGGLLDHVSSRVVDVLFALPSLLLAIVISAVLGPGTRNAVLAIVIVSIPLFSRVARSAALTERERDFIVSARAIGGSESRILLLHIFPNMLSPLTIQASITVAWAVLFESYLSYLGLGTQPPTPTWGRMLNEGQAFLEVAPWMSIFPGLAIMATVLGFNFLGDGLRDVLDPRSR